jgi:hypothetical protein
MKWNGPKEPNKVLTLQVIISPKWETQHNCELFGKEVHKSGPVSQKPLSAG